VDVAAQPGRGIGRDIGRGEAVERELTAFIEKRNGQRLKTEGERQQEELWKASVRAYEEKRRQAARLEWHLHHTAQAERLRRTLEALANHHEEQAARLIDIEPKGAA
jgi:ABC-type phosphonate transport system ATPase subunit